MPDKEPTSKLCDELGLQPTDLRSTGLNVPWQRSCAEGRANAELAFRAPVARASVARRNAGPADVYRHPSATVWRHGSVPSDRARRSVSGNCSTRAMPSASCAIAPSLDYLMEPRQLPRTYGEENSNAPSSVNEPGGALAPSASDVTAISAFSTCDLKQTGSTNVADVQLVTNEALGAAAAVNDNWRWGGGRR